MSNGYGGCINNPFNTDALTTNQRNEFLSSINDLLKKCLGRSLINSINSVNITVGEMNPGTVAQYRASTNSIVFKINNVGDGLGPELLHAFQQQIYGTLIDISNPSSGHIGGSNIEFEEKAFNIMLEAIEQNNLFNDPNNRTNGVFVGIALGYNQETVLLNDWIENFLDTHGANSIQNFSQSELNTWFEAMEQFQEYHYVEFGCGGQNGAGLYGCPIDYNLNPNVIKTLYNKSVELNCILE